MSPIDIKILIRADANPRIGTTNIRRGLALARAWKSIGGNATFVCGNLPRTLEKKIARYGFELYSIQHSQCDGNDARETNEIQLATSPDWTVLIGDRFDESYLSRLRNSRSKLMLIDRLGQSKTNAADLILKQAHTAHRSSTPFYRQQILCGPKYHFIDAHDSDDDEERHVVAQARKAFAILATKKLDESIEIVRQLSEIKIRKLVVDVMLPQDFEGLEELKLFGKESGTALRFHRSVDRFRDLADRADIAIAVDENAMMDLALNGVPTLVLKSAGLNSLIAIPNGPNNFAQEFDVDTFSAQFKELAKDPTARRMMSERGKQLVDGQGASRVARHLASDLFSFRDANEDDSGQLLVWRNEPEFRALTFEPQPISEITQREWLREKSRANSALVWIAEDNLRSPVGTLVFEFASDRAEIEICLCPSQRRKSLGTMLIEKACRHIFSNYEINRVLAKIRPSNVASQNAFKKAGFRLIAPTTRNGFTAMQLLLERQSSSLLIDEPMLRKSA